MSMLRSLARRLPVASLARPALTSTSTLHRISPINRQFIIGFSRQISTSSPLSQATTTTATTADDTTHDTDETKQERRGRPRKNEAEPSTISEYINRYGGWYPLIGLGAVVALSKELLVLNEEFLMVSNFAAFIFISWLAVGDTVTGMVQDQADAIRKNHDDVSDAYIESLETVIKAAENSLATIPLMQRVKTDYITLGEQVVRAKELKARAAARDAVMQRLNQVYQKEQNEKAKYLAAVYDNAYAEVQDRLTKLSEQDKAAMIDSAIATIGGATNDMDDPVARIYQEVINSNNSQNENEDADEDENQDEKNKKKASN